MATRRTLLTTFAVGAGVAALGVTATPAFAAVAPRDVAVKPGTTSSNVTSLQYLLSAYGYKTSTDGYYGPVTKTSVTKFQGAKGLVKDGDAGPITMKAMLNSSKVAAKSGWGNGNTVKAVQTQLVKLGYDMLIDGGFGPLTTTDVKKYQAKRKINQTGTVDYTTWTYMFNPPSSSGTGLRKGPAVLVSQSGSGLSTWAYDCGPSAFVCLQLRLGREPGKWTDVAHRGAAINYARRTDLHMYNNTRGTGQISDEVGITSGFHRIGVDRAKSGGFDAALSAVRSGGVSMLGGSLAVAAKWNGRTTSSALHWIALVNYSSTSGKYQVADSSSQYNKLVWVTRSQLSAFAASWGDSVYIK